MARYRVKAATLEGKVFYRDIEAASPGEVGIRLEKEGLYPLNIRPRGLGLAFLSGRGESKRELLVFNQGFSTLLKAGLSITESLEALKRNSSNARFSMAIEDALAGIRGGQSLSEAMRRRSEFFPDVYIASVAAAERTGDLIPAVRGFIEFQKRVEAIRKKVVSSATYPAVLAAASIIVVAFLLVYVVPSFAGLYSDAGAELPFPTRAFISVTHWIKGNFLYFLAAVAAVLAGLRFYLKTEKGTLFLDSMKLRLPRLGEVYRGYAISKFSRTLGLVLSSGMTLPEGLRLASGVLDNKVLEAKLDSVIRKTEEGSSVSEAFAAEGLLPDVPMSMFSVGERSASLPFILQEIAGYLDEEVGHRVDVLTDLLEPALMIIMGIIIGTIIVLMYLPIFQLGARI